LSSSSSAPPNGGRIYSSAGWLSSKSSPESQPIRHYLDLEQGEKCWEPISFTPSWPQTGTQSAAGPSKN
jgi:hypothetical protein